MTMATAWSRLLTKPVDGRGDRIGLQGDDADLDAERNLRHQLAHPFLEGLAHGHDVAAGDGGDADPDRRRPS